MLDERLIGTLFPLPQDGTTGIVLLYGIHYRYQLEVTQPAGTEVVVVAVSPLGLTVRPLSEHFAY